MQTQTSPQVIKHFSCSTQLSMKISLLINLKMPTISRKIFMLSMFSKKDFAVIHNLRFISVKVSCSAELSIKKFYNHGARSVSALFINSPALLRLLSISKMSLF